jgi:hypothetical protein
MAYPQTRGCIIIICNVVNVCYPYFTHLNYVSVILVIAQSKDLKLHHELHFQNP